MKDILWVLFELVVNFYQQSIIIITLAKCLGHKFPEKKHKRCTWCFIVILFLELSWMNKLIPFEGLGILISVLIVFTYAEICLYGCRIQKMFWAVSLFLIVMCITVVTLNIESNIIGWTYIELVQRQSLERFVGVLVIQIILFLAFRIIVRIFGKGRMYGLEWTEWLLIIVVPLISIFTMAFVTGIAVNAIDELSFRQQKFAVMAVLGIMLTNIMVYVLYQKLQKEHEKRFNYEMLKQNMYSQERGTQELQDVYLSIRKIKHDLNNHVIILSSMLEKKQIDEAKEYLTKYNEEVLGKIESKIFCENDVINHLINTKHSVCTKQGIHMYVLLCNDIPPISNVDLCILLANALDNAIEGCLSESRKEIYLSMRRADNFFMIQIKNTIDTSVLEKNPDLITTKKDKSIHGLGILSMREIAEKYYGSVDFNEENDFFCCNVLLDIEEYVK